MSYHHEINIRVYYQDTDAQGVVYHANYLNFAERGRAEFLRSRDDAFNNLVLGQGLTVVARHMEIEYLAAARLDDVIRLVTYAGDLRSTSFVVHSDAYLNDKLINKVKMTGVLVNKEWKPVRLSEELRAALL